MPVKAFFLTETPGEGLTGFAAALTFDALDDYGTLIADGFDHSIYETAPKAYLNVLLFDRDYNFVDAAYSQIGIDDEQGEDLLIKDPHGYLNIEKLVTMPGYAYIFLSNENPTQVDTYFDDLKLTHSKSPVVQMDDYYSFGLTFNSYKRENSTDNKYLYNQGTGEKTFLTERVFDLGLNVDLTKFRVYDPAVGRWWQVDPLADHKELVNWTPYNYGYKSNSI